MAMSNLPAGIVSWTFEDASGSTSKFQLHFPFASTVAGVITGAGAVEPLLLATTDCVIISRSISYAYYDPAHGAPTAGSRVEEKGVVIMRAANGRPSRVAIPAVKDSMLNPSGSIDRSDTDFAALFSEIIDTGSIFCAADGSDLVGVDKAYQAFRRSTKGSLPTDR